MASEEGDDNTSIYGAIGASLLGGLFSSHGQDKANETNIQLGREQMDFQKEMSNTAYQRAMKDMKAAGLNPMLAANVGGATTPSGAMPQVQNRISPGVASAQQSMQTMQAAQQINQSKAQESELRANVDKIKSETLERDLNTAKRAAEIEQSKSAAKAAQAMAAKTQEQIIGERYKSQQEQMTHRANMGHEEIQKTRYGADSQKARAQAESAKYSVSEDKAKANYFGDKTWGQYDPYIRSLLGISNGISSAARAQR